MCQGILQAHSVCSSQQILWLAENACFPRDRTDVGRAICSGPHRWVFGLQVLLKICFQGRSFQQYLLDTYFMSHSSLCAESKQRTHSSSTSAIGACFWWERPATHRDSVYGGDKKRKGHSKKEVTGGDVRAEVLCLVKIFLRGKGALTPKAWG